MVIYEDSRQQQAHGDKHAAKHAWWAAHGVEVVRRKLDFGDYMADGSNVSVDTKKGVAEAAQNICSSQHARFARECDRAAAAGCRLVVLVECRGFGCIADVRRWTNDHCVRCSVHHASGCDPRKGGRCPRHGTLKPPQGPRVAAAMETMERDRGVRFMFCRPSDSARVICDLLGVDYE